MIIIIIIIIIIITCNNYKHKSDVRIRHRRSYLQVAQLSQRDRATLRVIEYFAKSLKVIRNNTVE